MSISDVNVVIPDDGLPHVIVPFPLYITVHLGAPDVDEILKSNKGICFDYASLMAAMLRSLDIPAKLVTGYSSKLSVFHAWNEVYTEETGWMKLNEMYFDGFEWKLMDSTIASSGKQSNSPKVMEYTNKLIDSKYYQKQFEY
jgi:hypothetical protein